MKDAIKEFFKDAAIWVGLGLTFGFGFAISTSFLAPAFLRFVVFPLVF